MIDRELFVLPLLILLFCLHCACERHGFPSQSLHLYEPDAKHNKRSVAVFDRSQSDFDAGNSDDLYHSRSKRDAPASNPNGNITTRVIIHFLIRLTCLLYLLDVCHIMLVVVLLSLVAPLSK